MTGPAVPVRWTAVAAGSGLLLIVLATVVKGHYLQIEWHLTAAVPMVWWYAGTAAGLLGGPLFFTALGVGPGQLGDRPMRTVLPNLLWYTASAAAVLAILWRYGPGYGLTPVRDLPELLRFLVLPPSGLSVSYALALFPLLGWLVRGLPTPVVLGAGATVAVLGAVAAARVPMLAGAAELTRHLLFFLIGGRLGEALAGRAAPPATRPLAALGPAAAPIAAALLPVTALTGMVLVKRLSVLEGPLQVFVAVLQPALLTAVIVVAGVVAIRLRPVTR